MRYETVIGLEVHTELSTKTKIFCSCTTQFGGDPNTHCCPVCTGMPGTLPVLNRSVVEYAIRAGLATNCTITRLNKFDRKNYFYPDLPKAYQISQHTFPLCENGWLELSSGRRIRIRRIHIEEDAGKLMYDKETVRIDYNRSGVPLIEIVTEPDFRSSEEVLEYVELLRQRMQYLRISDCRMQEGSLRCDVNISVRKKGDPTLYTRTEIKNMNSLSFIGKAIEYEAVRQIHALQEGISIRRQTLRYLEKQNRTEPMREKETSEEYRYFPEPDLPPVVLAEDTIQELQHKLPEFPEEKVQRYQTQMHIPYDKALLLTKHRTVAEFFEAASQGLQKPSVVAHWITGPLFRRMETEAEKEQFAPAVSPGQLQELAQALEKKTVSSQAAKEILERMLDTGKDFREFLPEFSHSLLTESELTKLCQAAILQMPKAAEDYKKGKERAVKALVGAVMRASRGAADARSAEELLVRILNHV